MSWRWRVKLSVSASCHCSSLASILNGRLPPALLTRMSTAPSPSSASLAMRSGDPSCRRSATMSVGRSPPAATISLAVASSSSPRRATIARRAPSRASASAMPRPMPMLAPVTRAARPLSCKSMTDLREAGSPHCGHAPPKIKQACAGFGSRQRVAPRRRLGYGCAPSDRKRAGGISRDRCAQPSRCPQHLADQDHARADYFFRIDAIGDRCHRCGDDVLVWRASR